MCTRVRCETGTGTCIVGRNADGSAMGSRTRLRVPGRRIRRWAGLGLVALVSVVAARAAQADEGWADGRQFGLDAADVDSVAAAGDGGLVALLTPGSVLIAQAGATGTAAAPSEWQFRVTLYGWVPRIKSNLAVGPVSQSTTIDVGDYIPQLHFVFQGHAEATWREWTGFVDLFYVSVGQSQTSDGVSTSIGLQLGFFEFGGMYRLGPVSLGQAGRLAFEPLAGGRFMWSNVSIGRPTQKVSGGADWIDPIVGGRITYMITDTIDLWFRGDVGGFGISDSQSHLTYNLIAGVNWRFAEHWSAMVGWRYMNIDFEKGSGARTRKVGVELNGPAVAVTFVF